MRLKGEQEGEMIDAALKGVCERQCVCVCMCVCVCVFGTCATSWEVIFREREFLQGLYQNRPQTSLNISNLQ